jgi:hypothetical protein
LPEGYIYDVDAIAPDDAWAVGPAIVEGLPALHWNGRRWTQTHPPRPATSSYLYAVSAASSHDVWTVGYFVDSSIQSLSQHWDGTGWTQVPVPQTTTNNQLYDVAAIGPDDVWAVGIQDVSGGGEFQPLSVHWDGTAWTVVPTPPMGGDDNFLRAVAAVSTNDVWAVGSTEDPSVDGPLVLHWDGTVWSQFLAPIGNDAGSGLTGLSAISSTDVWGVGTYNSNQPPDYLPLTMHWDGTRWSFVSAPNPEGAVANLFDVSASGPTDIWAVGATQGSRGQILVEHSRGVCPG